MLTQDGAQRLELARLEAIGEPPLCTLDYVYAAPPGIVGDLIIGDKATAIMWWLGGRSMQNPPSKHFGE